MSENQKIIELKEELASQHESFENALKIVCDIMATYNISNTLELSNQELKDESSFFYI